MEITLSVNSVNSSGSSCLIKLKNLKSGVQQIKWKFVFFLIAFIMQKNKYGSMY